MTPPRSCIRAHPQAGEQHRHRLRCSELNRLRSAPLGCEAPIRGRAAATALPAPPPALSGFDGGICQSTNLLYWLVQHSELVILERLHHTCDPLPEERRVLPWSSGADVFYNYRDFQLSNPTAATFQICLWLNRHPPSGGVALGPGRAPSNTTCMSRSIGSCKTAVPASAETRSGAAP